MAIGVAPPAERKKAAKDWIGGAVKREGRVRKYLGVGKGETIPMTELQAAIKDLEQRKSDPSLLAALRLAKRFKQPGGI
jgi:hypothetical protein